MREARECSRGAPRHASTATAIERGRALVTPNGVALPHRVVSGIKVFHLIAEDVEREFAPGLRAHCFGYNGRVHGPTIEALVPAFEGMGRAGHGEVDDSVPPNSLPMVGLRGPFGYVTMSGMFAQLKVRDELEDAADPGWYAHPAGTVADLATPEQLARDGIDA